MLESSRKVDKRTRWLTGEAVVGATWQHFSGHKVAEADGEAVIQQRSDGMWSGPVAVWVLLILSLVQSVCVYLSQLYKFTRMFVNGLCFVLIMDMLDFISYKCLSLPFYSSRTSYRSLKDRGNMCQSYEKFREKMVEISTTMFLKFWKSFEVFKWIEKHF